MSETHEPQTNDSYLDPEIRGGGRPEEEASDAPSSFSSMSFVCVVSCGSCLAGDAGDDSREEGRSRKLRHDS